MNIFRKLFNIPIKEDIEIKKQEVKLSLDDLFVHNFVNKGGKFLYCTKKQEVVENLQKVLLENNWHQIHLLEKQLSLFLNKKSIQVLEKHTLMSPVFTTCEHLIADKGDILFSSNQLGSVKLNGYSENFIVFATTSQLVKDTGQGLTGIKLNNSGSLPTNISSIKNYSINKNDDNFLNYGNSNSKNLYLLLLEDL
ncbi:MAG: hypothetical protein WAO74_07300 [Polaribacter sp.]|uniref:hypothetical protein n=1 Tax=Polaribacter sp. TaxID=1920175 RepID=UPI003BAEDD60